MNLTKQLKMLAPFNYTVLEKMCTFSNSHYKTFCGLNRFMYEHMYMLYMYASESLDNRWRYQNVI